MIGPGRLDPRGVPADGYMEFIGGPKCGERWPIDVPHLWRWQLRQRYGGQYVYADTREWALVWVPDAPPRAA